MPKKVQRIGVGCTPMTDDDDDNDDVDSNNCNVYVALHRSME